MDAGTTEELKKIKDESSEKCQETLKARGLYSELAMNSCQNTIKQQENTSTLTKEQNHTFFAESLSLSLNNPVSAKELIPSFFTNTPDNPLTEEEKNSLANECYEGMKNSNGPELTTTEFETQLKGLGISHNTAVNMTKDYRDIEELAKQNASPSPAKN